MEYLTMDTLEGFLTTTFANKQYNEYLEKYKKTIASMAVAEVDTFLKRLEIMAYRQAMYHYKQIPADIERFIPKTVLMRYANFVHM